MFVLCQIPGEWSVHIVYNEHIKYNNCLIYYIYYIHIYYHYIYIYIYIYIYNIYNYIYL